jgi:hypothetical protein
MSASSRFRDNYGRGRRIPSPPNAAEGDTLKAVVRPLRSLAADWGLEAAALYHDCARRPRQRDRDYFTKRATAAALARCSKVLEAALTNKKIE